MATSERDKCKHEAEIDDLLTKCADEALATAERVVGPHKGLIATLALAMAFMGSALEAAPVLDMVIRHTLKKADELARGGKVNLAEQYVEGAKILSRLDLRKIPYECPRPAYFWPLRVSAEEMAKAVVDRVLQRFRVGNIYVVDFPIAPLAEFLHYSYAELDTGATLLGDPDDIKKMAPNAKIINRKIDNIGEYTTFLFVKYGDINAAISEVIRATGLPYEFVVEKILEYLTAHNTSPKVLAYLATYPYEFGKQIVRDVERRKEFEELREVNGALEIIRKYVEKYRQPPSRLKYAFARPNAAEYALRNIKEELAIGMAMEARRRHRRYKKKVDETFLSIEVPKERPPRIRQTLTPKELEKLKLYELYIYPRSCSIPGMAELGKFLSLINRIVKPSDKWKFRDVVRVKITPKYSRAHLDYVKQIYLPPQLGYINQFINSLLEIIGDENPIVLTAYINLMYEMGYLEKAIGRVRGEARPPSLPESMWSRIAPSSLNATTIQSNHYNIIRYIVAHVERQLVLQGDIDERAQLMEEVFKKLSGVKRIERPNLLSYAVTLFPKESISAAYALGGIGAALVMATMYLGYAKDIWDEWKKRRWRKRVAATVDDPIVQALIAYINGDMTKDRLKSIIPSFLLSQALARPMDLDDEDLPLKILRVIFDASVTDEYRALYEAVLMGAAANPNILASVIEGRGMADALAELGRYELPMETSEALREVLSRILTDRNNKRKALLEGDALLGDKPLAEIVAEISPIYALLRKGWRNSAEIDAAIEQTLKFYKSGGLNDRYFYYPGESEEILAEGEIERALQEFGERLKAEKSPRSTIAQILGEMPEQHILSLYYKAMFAAAADEIDELKISLANIVNYGVFFALPIYIRIYRLAVEYGKKEVAQLIEELI